MHLHDAFSCFNVTRQSEDNGRIWIPPKLWGKQILSPGFRLQSNNWEVITVWNRKEKAMLWFFLMLISDEVLISQEGQWFLELMDIILIFILTAHPEKQIGLISELSRLRQAWNILKKKNN